MSDLDWLTDEGLTRIGMESGFHYMTQGGARTVFLPPGADMGVLRDFARAVWEASPGPEAVEDAAAYKNAADYWMGEAKGLLRKREAQAAEIARLREELAAFHEDSEPCPSCDANKRLQRSVDDALERLRVVTGQALGECTPEVDEWSRGDEAEAVAQLIDERDEAIARTKRLRAELRTETDLREEETARLEEQIRIANDACEANLRRINELAARAAELELATLDLLEKEPLPSMKDLADLDADDQQGARLYPLPSTTIARMRRFLSAIGGAS